MKPVAVSNPACGSKTDPGPARPSNFVFRLLILATVVLTISTISLGVALGLVDSSSSDNSAAAVKNDKVSFDVSLVSYNDAYQVDEIDGMGGAGRVKAAIDGVRSMSNDTLVLMPGDTLSPSLMSTYLMGSQMVDVHNLVGLDYFGLGNHEFDVGINVMQERIAESNFVWLNSNAFEVGTGELLAKTTENAVWVAQKSGLTIGLFSVMYVMNTDNSSGVFWTDPVKAAALQVEKLQAQGVDYIVALTHQNSDADCEVVAIEGVDLVVGGHDHKAQYNSNCAKSASYVKGTSDWQDMWRVTGFTKAKEEPLAYRLMPLSGDLPKDEAVERVVQAYNKEDNIQNGVVVGESASTLDCDTAVVRAKEAIIGNIIADSLRANALCLAGTTSAPTSSCSSDVSYINGGGIRSGASYPPGNLTRGDVISIQPFQNFILTWEMTAEQMRYFFELAFSTAEAGSLNGFFPHVSGCRIVFDMDEPPMSRTTSFTQANGTAWDANARYKMSFSDYISGKFVESRMGSGEAFEGIVPVVTPNEANLDVALFESYLSQMNPIEGRIEGRVAAADERRRELKLSHITGGDEMPPPDHYISWRKTGSWLRFSGVETS